MIGKEIITSVETRNAVVALLGFIGIHYVLDFDYPQNHEVGLSIFHSFFFFFFQNTHIPGDFLRPFNSVLDEYNTYKSSG